MLRDISEFEPQMEFIKGCDNVVADALSRLGITPLENHNDEAALTLGMVKSDRIKDFIDFLENFKLAQTTDPALKHTSLRRQIKRDCLPFNDSAKCWHRRQVSPSC